MMTTKFCTLLALLGALTVASDAQAKPGKKVIPPSPYDAGSKVTEAYESYVRDTRTRRRSAPAELTPSNSQQRVLRNGLMIWQNDGEFSIQFACSKAAKRQLKRSTKPTNGMRAYATDDGCVYTYTVAPWLDDTEASRLNAALSRRVNSQVWVELQRNRRGALFIVSAR